MAIEPLTGDIVFDFEESQPVIGLQIQPFNWRLRRAREARGWSRAELARQIQMSPGIVGDAERLRRVSAVARERMALALGVPEDVLFPGEIDDLRADGPPTIELSLTAEDVRSLSERDSYQDMIEGAEHAALRDEIAASLATLPEREARVVRQRFGLEDGDPRTLEEISDAERVGKERIRQIEANALRKLRRSSRSKQLRPFMPDQTSYQYRAPLKPGQCQRVEEGRTCRDRFALPPWMHARPFDELRRPMFWCEACWGIYLTARKAVR
jgi:transcriptional regulator with XRE-family HTH domain